MKIKIKVGNRNLIIFSVFLLFSSLFVLGVNWSSEDSYHDTLFVDTLRDKDGSTVNVYYDLEVDGFLYNSQVPLAGDFCVFTPSQTSCPSNFYRLSELDEKVIRGSASDIGTTGGSSTHKHTITADLEQIDDSGHADVGFECWGGSCDDPDSASSYPPYVRSLVCCLS